ncbi:peptide-binding protein [Caldalkalibacillus salinus]|uniref:peptide-binding protein n=1 Tax=Caldalkalibacillus salinus TaxID=2803787 RepID=UPI0019207E9D|nr:peptide-binding protein [Caldalkalibacillus salinus]
MSQKKTLILFLGLMMVFSLFLAACGQETETGTEPEENDEGSGEEAATGEPQTGGDLVWGQTGSPTLFNPYYSEDTVSSAVENLIYDSLLQSDPNFEPEPRMAEDWNVSDDGLVYTFNLKEGITWHDGEPLTADDVVFSYSIPLHEDYDGPRASTFERIDKIEALDDHTVQITLSEPDAKFIWVGGYHILPEHILGDVPIADIADHDFNTKKPIGTGPFVFEEWQDGQHVKMSANEDYYQGRPYLDTVTFKIVPDANNMLVQLQGGDVNYWSKIPEGDVRTVKKLEDQGQLKTSTTTSLSYTYLGYNLRNELFQDPNVRKAMTHAINREELVEVILDGQGEVAHAPSSPLSWAFNPDTIQYDFDPEKAKELLAEAGWEPGEDGILEKDGKRFSFELKTNQGNKTREESAVVIQEYLSEVGIEVKTRVMEWSAFINDVQAPNWNFEAIILGWALGTDPDPTGIWHSKEIENGLNFVAYENDELDELMDEQIVEMDFETRQQMIWDIFGKIAEDQPYTFLFYPTETAAMPTNLHDHTHHPRNREYNVHEWWLEQ